MYICLKSTKDVVVDLMIDNLFDEEYNNASNLGELARDIQGCINRKVRLTSEFIASNFPLIYVVDDNDTYVDVEKLCDYDSEAIIEHLCSLEQK